MNRLLGDLGFGELLIILVAGLVIFGPQKLPELGRALGTTLRELRRASQQLMAEVAEATRDLEEAGSGSQQRPGTPPGPGPGGPGQPPESGGA